MKVTWGIENVERTVHTALTLGSFDGLHLGHQAILKRLIALKEEMNIARTVVLTFHPHPQEVLRRNNSTLSLLTTIDERLTLIAETGIDEAIVLEFTPQLASTPYSEFFQKYIISMIGTEAMVVGFNHAFGKNREGDITHLRELATTSHIYIEETPPYFVGEVSISSTKIRNAITAGEIEKANAYLGRRYGIGGVVEEGDKIGRTLNFPTANMQVDPRKLLPQDGVYAGVCTTEFGRYKAAVSIGVRPTLTTERVRKVEAFLLDFTGDLYGQNISIEFDSFIRSQEKFDGLEALKIQMQKDVVETETRLSRKGL